MPSKNAAKAVGDIIADIEALNLTTEDLLKLQVALNKKAEKIGSQPVPNVGGGPGPGDTGP